MFKRQTGFTLIELIVVIVILGILAATALPKFMGIQGGARAAVLDGARGAVTAAMNIAYATQQSLGYSAGQPVTLEGTTINMVNRYPAAGSIYTAAGLSADYSATVASNVTTIFVKDASSTGTCFFTYTEAPNTSSVAAVSPTTKTGC